MSTEDTSTRKLTAIMFIDMVGYTAMMQKDEPKTQGLVKRQRELTKPLVVKHSGEVLRYVGDGTLCTFRSAIEAVNCALDIQKALKEEDEMNLRIGIHIGDIVFEGDDIYGDGVNVASRIEPLAEPGGICISHQVYENIKNQPGIKVNYLGEKVLKNVDSSLKIYSLIGEGLKAAKPFEGEQKPTVETHELVLETVETESPLKKLLPWVIGAAVLLILFFAKGWFSGESSITEVTADENSLAVLFIENMTDPTDADRSAEMIRMLLATDLSQAHSLRIIGSQRLYDIAKQERKGGGQLIDRSNASAVARKSGAQWMLTGTLAKIGDRMVLATEIENVKTGKVLDAQRADGNDIFSLVDALSSEIRSDMGVIASAGEIDAPVKEITTSSSEAYQRYLEGIEFLNDFHLAEAIKKFNHAVEIDSNFTKALYKIAVAQWLRGEDLLAQETVKKILLNKESLVEGELLLVEGLESLMYNDYSTAKDMYQRLLKLYPDEKEIYFGLGEAYFHSGKGEQLKALDAFEEALNLDPEFRLPYEHIFHIYQQEGMGDKALRVANRLINSNPDNARSYRYLAEVYGWKGELDNSIKNYEKSSELNRGNYESINLQGWAYRIGGKYEEALSEYAKLLKPDVPVTSQYGGKRSSSYVYAEQGQYKKAIRLTLEAARIGRPIAEQNFIVNMVTLADLADFYSSRGDTVRAFSLLDSALAMNPDIDMERWIYWDKGRLYAGSGNQEKLKKLIAALNMPAKQIGVISLSWDAPKSLKMELYRLQGNIEKAMIEYDKMDILGRLLNLSLKATLYGDARDWENVILTADEMQASFLYFLDSRHYDYPRAFYIRGKAYEEMGKPELAIENYEALLELWKDADEEIPERRDTIKRLTALKRGS